MAKFFKFLKGGLLVALLAVLAIGGIKFMGHNERQTGHAQYQANEQRGEYESQQSSQYTKPAFNNGDRRYTDRGETAYQANEVRGKWENTQEHERHHEWGAFAVIPLIFAGLLILLGWTLLRKTNIPYLKWIGGLLLVIMLWPLALAGLVIYAGWKLFNKNRKQNNYVSESYLVHDDLQASNFNQVHTPVASVDFLDEWEKQAKSKRDQEDSK